MMIPSWLIKPLLRWHESGEATPFYHLPGYMLRSWLLGDRSAERNTSNRRWHGRQGRIVYRWITHWVAIRAHTILRSDRDRHLHDHPCASISIVLDGGYWEVLEPNNTAKLFPNLYKICLSALELQRVNDASRQFSAMFNIHWRGPGDIVCRSATTRHKLILPKGKIAKSIFVLGPKRNSWGFYTESGKIPWRTYLGVDSP